MIHNKLKVVCTTWHVMHFWDLFNALKEDANFYLIHNNHRSWKDKRFLACRPIPENATFVPYYEKGKYDLAILDVDQQLVNPELGKTQMMKELKEEIEGDIPIIFINHGSPVYPEFLKRDSMTEKDAQKKCIKIIKEFIGEHIMVVNSYTAATEKEWGWGYPIWHGLDMKEWYCLPKEPRIFTALSPGGCDTYYNRECAVEVMRILEENYGYKMFWAKVNVKFDILDEYKQFLGSSLLYFDPSFRTPMNRARTEAMLSGCCVIQVENAHDLDKFAKDGENMVIVPNNPKEITKIIVNFLQKNYKKAFKIGQNCRETAIKLFDREKYRINWLKLINQII